MLLLIYAHPHHSRSIANRRLLDAVRDLPELTVHSLYDRYPDFSIDAMAEHELLTKARIVVWQHPLYWYSAPALLKLWFEQVLVRGWAFDDGGQALRAKHCLWVTTTGGAAEGYQSSGAHQHEFESFVPVMRQTAQFCQMNWHPPLVVHGAHRVTTQVLEQQAQHYRERLLQLIEQAKAPSLNGSL